MPTQTNIQVTVDGRWLSLESFVGDVEFSTVWPGGSDELSWTMGSPPARPFRGDEVVVGYFGGVRVFGGTLVEPDPSQDRMTAQGLWRQGEDFAALTSGGAAGTSPDQSVDQAISRGLRWSRPNSISAVGTPVDVSQGPITVGGLLDFYAANNQVRWGVDPSGVVYATADPTAPTYQTLPLNGGLGYALDNYASTLVCRYLDSATSTYKTVIVTDANAVALHGYKETVLDLTERGAISTTTATNFGNSLLNLGASTPQWTESISFAYGEILSIGGVPVALETIMAGQVVRVHGGGELAMRQNGAMYVDFLIGQTSLSDGTLTIQPLQHASRAFTDVLTSTYQAAIDAKKKR